MVNFKSIIARASRASGLKHRCYKTPTDAEADHGPDPEEKTDDGRLD